MNKYINKLQHCQRASTAWHKVFTNVGFGNSEEIMNNEAE